MPSDPHAGTPLITCTGSIGADLGPDRQADKENAEQVEWSIGGTRVSLCWAIDATGEGSDILSMLEPATQQKTAFSVYLTRGQSSPITESDELTGKQSW